MSQCKLLRRQKSDLLADPMALSVVLLKSVVGGL
jgi:hypothetical protein